MKSESRRNGVTVKKVKTTPRLRRYTDLSAAIHILQTKSLTLTDPDRWDDGNDRFSMAEYKKRRGLQSLLAMCFADCGETYHHWRVFTEGKSGVCFELDKIAFLESLDALDGFEYRKVDYRRLNILSGNPGWNVADLPFIKRAPYKPEKELRVIFCSDDSSIDAVPVPIEPRWIKSIRLSPWMPKPLHDAVRRTLKKIDGFETLPVQSTSLIGSDTWKRWVEHAS
jgi:hypothetical protein